jgi:CheY-like chemotaxis protein
VINEILSFSELEAEEIHIRAEHFNLNEVFSRLMVSLESIKEDKPIKLQLNLDPQLPEMVRGDGMKLKQALSHLGGLLVRSVNNGELVVEANLQKEDVQKIGLEVVFRFNPGNLDDRLVNLFIDSRDNINSTRMLRYDTQAMGLHMAAQIIRALGGEAFAHGSPARSIGFRLEFSKVEMGQIELEKPINTRLRILVVEDNPVNRKLIEMMFNSLGLSSSMAENGQIALDKVKEGNFHMVFMDLQMPVMDGIESTKLILDQVAHRPIIIALTANSTEDDRQMAMEAGMNDFMTKPLKINELKNMILKWQSVSEILDEL